MSKGFCGDHNLLKGKHDQSKTAASVPTCFLMNPDKKHDKVKKRLCLMIPSF